MHRGFFMKISTKETKNKQTKGKENTTLTLRIYFFTELQRLEIECQTVDTIPAPQVFKPCLLNTTSISINYCSTLYLHNFSFRLISQDPLAFLGLQKNVECRRIEKLVIHIARLLSEEIRQLHSLGHFLKLPQRIKFSIIIKFSP